jgi:hypothetical protein
VEAGITNDQHGSYEPGRSIAFYVPCVTNLARIMARIGIATMLTQVRISHASKPDGGTWPSELRTEHGTPAGG